MRRWGYTGLTVLRGYKAAIYSFRIAIAYVQVQDRVSVLGGKIHSCSSCQQHCAGWCIRPAISGPPDPHSNLLDPRRGLAKWRVIHHVSKILA